MKDAERRQLCGWVVTALGLLCILWGVFHVTNATVGGRVTDFAHRRTYNEVKVAAQQAYPGFILRALVGSLLIWGGARIRSSKR